MIQVWNNMSAKSSHVTFIYIELYTIQMASKQLYSDNR